MKSVHNIYAGGQISETGQRELETVVTFQLRSFGTIFCKVFLN